MILELVDAAAETADRTAIKMIVDIRRWNRKRNTGCAARMMLLLSWLMFER